MESKGRKILKVLREIEIFFLSNCYHEHNILF